MDGQEKGACIATNVLQTPSNLSNSSIQQQCTALQAVNDDITKFIAADTEYNNQEKIVAFKKKKDRHPLNHTGSTYTFAFKFYVEQITSGDIVDLWAHIASIDKKDFQIIAIMHYKDNVTDGCWKKAIEKPHFHVIGRCTDRKKRVKVDTMLNMLGVYYRPGLDDELWLNKGAETIGSFASYAMYLTHETEEAIRDQKELYDFSELRSNMTAEEIKQIRDGFIRVSTRKVDMQTFSELDEYAYQLGYEMKNFEQWYNAQPFAVRTSTHMRTIRESYERGVEAKISENAEIVRLCVFIHGKGNLGKTYSTEQTLTNLGKSFLRVNGGGTGKFDKLRADHDAIIIDDDVCPNLLNMSDNYICRAYKRNSGNPAWAGKYFIVTSNLTFAEWCAKCGIDKVLNYGTKINPNYSALLSRFYIARIWK